MTFSEKYSSSFLCSLVWFAILALWCGTVLDMGESLYTFLYSAGGYVVLLLLIVFRRPAKPTKLDLLLVGWGLPILFFAGLTVLPLIWHY